MQGAGHSAPDTQWPPGTKCPWEAPRWPVQDRLRATLGPTAGNEAGSALGAPRTEPPDLEPHVYKPRGSTRASPESVTQGEQA